MIQAGSGTLLAPRRRRGIQVASSSGGIALSAYDQAVLADNPISYYRFVEASGTAAADSGSGGNTGTYTGGVTLNQTGAVAGGKSILLDGTSGYVNVPDAAGLRLTVPFTLEAWVKPTDLTNFWFVITKDLVNAARAFEWRIDQTTGKPDLIIGNANAATTAVTAAAWNHIAVTFESGTANVQHYLNGATNGGVLAGVSNTDGGTPVKIGARDDLTIFFKGSIANPALYNTSLSAARILAHWNAR